MSSTGIPSGLANTLSNPPAIAYAIAPACPICLPGGAVKPAM